MSGLACVLSLLTLEFSLPQRIGISELITRCAKHIFKTFLQVGFSPHQLQELPPAKPHHLSLPPGCGVVCPLGCRQPLPELLPELLP